MFDETVATKQMRLTCPSFLFDLTFWSQGSKTCSQAKQLQQLSIEIFGQCIENCASKSNVVSISKQCIE